MQLSSYELQSFSTFAQKTAVNAGKILSEGFHKNKQVVYKGRIDPVTQFDMKSEKYIISRIIKHYPDHSILAEEGTDIKNHSGFRWVIDPLDGTVNYAHGLPVYCVSIGLQLGNKTIIGVVYNPETKELYSATSGKGAYLNKKRLAVSKESSLQRSLLATGFPYDVATAKINNLGKFTKMMKHAQAVRRYGSAALDLCWVAEGRFEGFWEYGLHPWDSAASILVVTEAGGKISRINGSPYSIFDRDLLASNTKIHTKMQKILYK